MKTIGFIGAGNMAFAMIGSAAEKLSGVTVTYTDINQARLEAVKEATGISYVEDNMTCVEQSDVIVLAVKPQYYETVLNEIKEADLSNKIIVSIAPGITIDWIKAHLGASTKVVRSMPNTPALVKEGMSGVSYSSDVFAEEDKQLIQEFFVSFGRVVVMTEKQLDMVVPVSGSSPAYVYMFIEAMADAAVLTGLPRDVAYELAAQAVYGSAKMVLESGLHPGMLKDQVCSPGGTTIEAVRVLEEKGFRSAVIEAMTACYEKTLKFK